MFILDLVEFRNFSKNLYLKLIKQNCIKKGSRNILIIYSDRLLSIDYMNY